MRTTYWLRRASARLRGLLSRRSVEREMDEEMRFHLRMRAEENVRRGMSRDEAERAALRSFGSLTRVKEAARDMKWGGWIETVWQDARYAARTLRKSPNFTLVAVVTLALGIGANTAIFSVVNAVLLRPLPYADPDRLVMLWENDTQEGNDRNPVSPGNFADWKRQNTTCTDIAFYNQPAGVNVTGGEPERITGAGVSQNIFALMGVRPLRGRTFSESEAASREVVIGYGLWQRRFAGDTDVVGRQMNLDGESFEVVGVMPAEFQLPEESELWWANRDGELETMRSRHFLRVLGRLRPGVRIEQARVEFDTIARRLAQQYPDTNTGYGITVITLQDQLVGGVRPALLVLLGAVAFVLLIACANVANLLLARAAARRKEVAVRAALGAGRARLVRQLLTESLLLALAGGAAGLLLAFCGVRLLSALGAASLPRAAHVGIDARVLAFTCLTTVLTGVVFGLAPARAASRIDLQDVLREGGRGATSVRSAGGLLVVCELACSLVLLSGAGLLVKSFMRLQAVDPGFNPAGVLTVQFSLPESKYPEPRRVAAFYGQLLERLRALPGVRAAGAISRLPLAGDRSTSSMTVEGRPTVAGQFEEVHYRVVTPDYFRALEIPLRAGRELTERDREGAPPVVLVNEKMAGKYWPGADAVGKRIKVGPNPAGDWITVAGVVGDVRNFGLESEAKPEVYVPYLQGAQPRMRVIVRTEGDPLGVVPSVRSAVRSLDTELPFSQISTMEQLLARSVAQRRLSTQLLAVFAVAALLLAAVGIYGVMAYTVTQRTREIGVRMALGAQRRDILLHVVGRGARLLLLGVVVGLVASLAATRMLAGMLYGVEPTDAPTFALVTLTLCAIALAACYLPARRATKVDPLIALRAE